MLHVIASTPGRLLLIAAALILLGGGAAALLTADEGWAARVFSVSTLAAVVIAALSVGMAIRRSPRRTLPVVIVAVGGIYVLHIALLAVMSYAPQLAWAALALGVATAVLAAVAPGLHRGGNRQGRGTFHPAA
jgi:hypothetical protein